MAKHCVRTKTVTDSMGRKVKRCADFAGTSTGAYAKGHKPANAGKKCTKKTTVYSPAKGKNVTRCAKFGGARK